MRHQRPGAKHHLGSAGRQRRPKLSEYVKTSSFSPWTTRSCSPPAAPWRARADFRLSINLHSRDSCTRSPALQWFDAPAQTKSFVLLCDDPDAPAGVWRHWAAYNIPVDRTGLIEGAGQPKTHDYFKQAINDFRRLGYGGPCPPLSTRNSSIPFSPARPFTRRPSNSNPSFLRRS